MQSFATKTKKAIQKVAAIGTGVAMMGATITGALAVSIKLNDYPSAFKDALVVVGTAAAGADDVAATDVAGDLPTTSKVTEISGDTYTIEKGGNKFNMNQELADIDPSVTDTELDLLADQTFKDDEGTNTGDYDYTQTLHFSNDLATNTSGQLVFEQDTSGNRENDPADTYLKFSSSEGRWAWNYTLKITGSKVKIKDSADIENNVLSILGRDWTITDASMENTSYGTLDKLTLLAGDVLQTILQGSSVGGVTVVDVDEAETKCIVEYAGKTYIIDQGQTKTMDDGTIIGITDVTAVHESGAGQDMCELAIGAHKLVLEDGKKASVNNEDVDNSLVFISGNETANVAGLKNLIISYQPEDNTWLLPGESLEDPLFGAFKIVFNKIVEEPEEIKIDIVGDKVKVNWKNKDGDIFDNYICFLNGTGTNRQMHLGYSDSKPMAVFDGQTFTNNTVGIAGTYVTPKGMKGVRFLMTFNGISHIGEITEIDSSMNRTTIKMLDTGEVYKDLEYVDGAVAGTALSDIDSNLVIKFMINNAVSTAAGNAFGNITFVNIHDGDARWETYHGGNISFYNHSGGTLPENSSIFANAGPGGDGAAGRLGGGMGCDMTFTEVDTSKETEVVLLAGATTRPLNISFRYDSTDDQIEWNASGSSGLGTSLALRQKDTESTYDYKGRTSYGTYIEMYQKNDGDLTIYYPDEATYAELIVAASEAVTGTLGTVTAVKESEVTDVAAQDVILVGGPCANGLTAKFTGEGTVWPDCNTNYKAGEAVLKLFDNGNNVALVVAGYGADDTQRAAVALGGTLPAQTSAKVTGTSLELSEITVA